MEISLRLRGELCPIAHPTTATATPHADHIWPDESSFSFFMTSFPQMKSPVFYLDFSYLCPRAVKIMCIRANMMQMMNHIVMLDGWFVILL